MNSKTAGGMFISFFINLTVLFGYWYICLKGNLIIYIII